MHIKLLMECAFLVIISVMYCVVSKKKDRDARKRKKHDPQNMSIRELFVHFMLFCFLQLRYLVCWLIFVIPVVINL